MVQPLLWLEGSRGTPSNWQMAWEVLVVSLPTQGCRTTYVVQGSLGYTFPPRNLGPGRPLPGGLGTQIQQETDLGFKPDSPLPQHVSQRLTLEHLS